MNDKYAEFLASPEWRSKRYAISARQGFACWYCGEKIGKTLLVIHHLKYTDDLLNADWLIGLCEGCHNSYHGVCQGGNVGETRFDCLLHLRQVLRDQGRKRREITGRGRKPAMPKTERGRRRRRERLKKWYGYTDAELDFFETRLTYGALKRHAQHLVGKGRLNDEDLYDLRV